MTFDLTSARMVLAGTLFGEVRGYGRACAENVAQVILNRVKAGWNKGGLIGVCLAPQQFSCWNVSDPNRAKILAAPTDKNNAVAWLLALNVADGCLASRNVDRVLLADSYFARSMIAPPYWARLPARQTFADQAHLFWQTRDMAANTPTRSILAHPPAEVEDATDKLNDAQLASALARQSKA